MKRLFISAIIFATSFFSNAQVYEYTMLSEYENYILDQYDINYTGIHVRYMVESGQISTINDSDTKDSMLAAYNRFTKFNRGYFQNVPTISSNVLLTGTQYIKNKTCDNFTSSICDDTRLIVGIYKKLVNDVENNIRSIEIVEINNSAALYSITHAIFIEDFYGFSTLIIPQDFTGMKLCGQCPIE
jgi:hypothetical protein